jgi:hypothetical protein
MMIMAIQGLVSIVAIRVICPKIVPTQKNQEMEILQVEEVQEPALIVVMQATCQENVPIQKNPEMTILVIQELVSIVAMQAICRKIVQTLKSQETLVINVEKRVTCQGIALIQAKFLGLQEMEAKKDALIVEMNLICQETAPIPRNTPDQKSLFVTHVEKKATDQEIAHLKIKYLGNIRIEIGAEVTKKIQAGKAISIQVEKTEEAGLQMIRGEPNPIQSQNSL